MGGMVNLTLFALLTAVISLSQFLSLIESRENTVVEFYLANQQMGWQKNIFVLLSHSLLFKFNPNMMTSTAEKPGNVKRVD